jgi:hypothetical protein
MPQARTGGQAGRTRRLTASPAKRPAKSDVQPRAKSAARPAAKSTARQPAKSSARTAARPTARTVAPPAARSGAPSGGPAVPRRPLPTQAWTLQTALEQLSAAERAARGKAARAAVPRESHAAFDPPADRPDPVAQLEEQGKPRIPELVPVRYGRMMASPFSYFRGAALPMAADLATTPDTGLTVQACGDAHLSNFGLYASPERKLLFDVNDFDETLPGPWEWDVKRLAASLEVASRGNGFARKDRRAIVQAAAAGYRQAMRRLAAMNNLAVWYTDVDIEGFRREFAGQLSTRQRKTLDKAFAKAPVPADQGGAAVGSQPLSRRQQVRQPGGAGRRGPTAHAVGQRYLPRLAARAGS